MATGTISKNRTNEKRTFDGGSVESDQLTVRAMCQSAREHAAKLNPIISLAGMPDTLSQCAQLVDQLGRFVANAADSGDSGVPLMFLFTGVISSAIKFEVEASHV